MGQWSAVSSSTGRPTIAEREGSKSPPPAAVHASEGDSQGGLRMSPPLEKKTSIDCSYRRLANAATLQGPVRLKERRYEAIESFMGQSWLMYRLLEG